MANDSLKGSIVQPGHWVPSSKLAINLLAPSCEAAASNNVLVRLADLTLQTTNYPEPGIKSQLVQHRANDVYSVLNVKVLQLGTVLQAFNRSYTKSAFLPVYDHWLWQIPHRSLGLLEPAPQLSWHLLLCHFQMYHRVSRNNINGLDDFVFVPYG